MPLDDAVRKGVHAYCTRDLPGSVQWHEDQFSFIGDIELRKRLGRAFYSARYIGKLMEALLASGDEIHPFVKFQIMQYASIYEAVISYLLWNRYNNEPAVVRLRTHKAYKPVSALSKLTNMKYDGEELFTCVYRDAQTPKNSIPFRDQVDCAVQLGIVEETHASDMKRIYELRNLAHIETEAKKQIEVELEQAKMGYWRMKPFFREDF